MKYRIELAATAKADIRVQAHWLFDRLSPAAADKWLDGLYEAINTLQTRPSRCSVAAESDKFPEEIRELLYGGSGKKAQAPDSLRDPRRYRLSPLCPAHRP